MDFGKRTFLERVALAAREPVYSAAIAWMLEDQSPLPLQSRLEIVKRLSGMDVSDGTSIAATTEWNDLDVLLTVKRPGRAVHVAIENKIKAVEGDGQLATYDVHLARLQGDVVKVFLTLSGEAAVSGASWKSVRYAQLHDALKDHDNVDTYVADLLDAVGRLVAVAEAAGTDAPLAEVSFGDSEAPEASDVCAYIEEMRLHKVVQRAWMIELARRLEINAPWRCTVGETRGQALLNVQAALKDHPGFVIGLQLQARGLKAFAHPAPYPRRATQEQHKEVEQILGTMKRALGTQSARLTSSRNRGFRSFNVDTLPNNRDIDRWAEKLRPRVRSIISAFSSAEVSDAAIVEEE